VACSFESSTGLLLGPSLLSYRFIRAADTNVPGTAQSGAPTPQHGRALLPARWSNHASCLLAEVPTGALLRLTDACSDAEGAQLNCDAARLNVPVGGRENSARAVIQMAGPAFSALRARHVAAACRFYLLLSTTSTRLAAGAGLHRSFKSCYVR
jgi:hypothetical protein